MNTSFLRDSFNISQDNIHLKTVNGSLLPVATKIIMIPENAQIISLNVSFSGEDVFPLDENLKASLVKDPMPKNKQVIGRNVWNQHSDVFAESRKTRIPQAAFDYAVGCGSINGQSSVIITIQVFPLTYDEATNEVCFPSHMQYHLKYDMNSHASVSDSTVDLVIISPSEFMDELQPLVEHKNNVGISTIIKTTEDIYSQYSGRDNQEQIKYFIKDALDQWDITYVLLVGGKKGQTDEWYVPVRYSNLHDRSFWNDTYVTDLYYADVYRYDQQTSSYVFEDWDENNNGIFGEWTWIFDHDLGWWYDLDKKDNLDLYPDVALGRLACRSGQEVAQVVEKIIIYETTSYGQEWFNDVIYCGGDTVPFSDGICEGELENEYAASVLEPIGFQSKKLWVSTGTLQGPQDVLDELKHGAGFFYLSGHGTPREWCTHPVADDYRWIDLYAFQMRNIGNTDKLPICVVGGCHNSQFDVGLSQIRNGFSRYGLSYFTWDEGIDCFFKWGWVPTSWSWNLVSQAREGCIAVIGNTGLGWGVGGTHCTEFNEGYLTSRFFEIYADSSQQGVHNLGLIHQESLQNYISHFSANQNLLDRKTVEEWVLLGDPSLRIGGYPPQEVL